jgi:hypothetical protein
MQNTLRVVYLVACIDFPTNSCAFMHWVFQQVFRAHTRVHIVLFCSASSVVSLLLWRSTPKGQRARKGSFSRAVCSSETNLQVLARVERARPCLQVHSNERHLDDSAITESRMKATWFSLNENWLFAYLLVYVSVRIRKCMLKDISKSMYQ